MGKHSKVKENKKIKIHKSKVLIILFIIIAFILISFIFKEPIKNLILKIQLKDEWKETAQTNEKNSNKQLTLKSILDYNRIITFEFDNNILQTIIVYEQYKEKEEFIEKKKDVEIMQNIEVLNINENEQSIEIKKNDLGEDKNKSYEEIYDKYINQLIGMYKIIS